MSDSITMSRDGSPSARFGLKKRSLIALNVIGGVSVLASYVLGLRVISGDALWGGVPDVLRPLYTVNMFLAAGGYFLFTHYVVFRLDVRETHVAGRYGYGVFHLFYALVLLPSALWLPLTAHFVEQPGTLAWALVRVDLALVALGSLGLVASLLRLEPDAPPGRVLALVGLAPFFLQTAVLDALIWPAYFPSPIAP